MVKYLTHYHFIVLDPRISYEGLKEDFVDDVDLLSSLDITKSMLHDHFKNAYVTVQASDPRLSAVEVSVSTTGSTTRSSTQSKDKVDFTARYRAKNRAAVDELEEYFKLPQEDFESCNPLHSDVPALA